MVRLRTNRTNILLLTIFLTILFVLSLNDIVLEKKTALFYEHFERYIVQYFPV